MTAFAVHPMERGDPPAWATAWGQDRFGVWAAFSVGEGERRIEQRMRWIVPGDFTMGSPDDEEGRWEDEGPQRRVRISRGFWLAETPCTQALWTAVTGDNPSRFKGEQRPVERVSFEDVRRFCAALADRVSSLSPRLPTEAEWEYACRAGSDLPVYPLPGESTAANQTDVAWFSVNCDGTQPVAGKAPNPWGLHDMLGNVYEWCQDSWYDYEPTHELLVDPLVDVSTLALRVVRGGSWSGSARGVRAANRGANLPGDAYDFVGFRLARGPGAAQPEPAERA